MVNLDELRERINLVDLINESVSLRKAGTQWKGICPFHADRNASLSVSEKFFKCFGCDASGDVITWVERTQNLPTGEVIRWLAERYGIANHNGNKPVKPDPKPEPIKTMDRAIAETFHRNLPPEHREYYRQRGLSDETIDHFLLGWDGTRYTIPIFVDGQLRNVRRRRDDKNKRDLGDKMLNTGGFGTATLFNQDVLHDSENVVIAEGEFDAMLLAQHGWKAVSSTSGAATFKSEWVKLFASCRTIYVCYDNDLPGRSGAVKVAKLLGNRARIVNLPEEVGEGGDITDFFGTLGRTDTDFLTLLEAARPYELPPEPEEESPIPVHLAQSARSTLVGKKVGVKILVAGKLDAPYIVPRKVRYTCFASPKDRETCGAANDEDRSSGYWDKTFDDKDPIFIELCHKQTEQVGRVLRTAAGCQGTCRKFGCQVLAYANVEEVLAVPMAERVMPREQGSTVEVDEEGNEYVARNLYLLDDQAIVNQYYEITGRVYPHPKHQLGTILITKQQPLQDNISQFALTEEVRATFTVFQPQGNIVEHVNAVLDDLTKNVTRIYRRDEALLAVLLAYHSILNFTFEDQLIGRGWLEVLLVGDTGLGKTRIVRQLMDFCGLGALVSGETARRTGLTYSIQEIGERWFIKWGKYPLNDRRLLAIDELSELPEDDLAQMTQGRNDGILRVDRAGVGEANCRTRLVWMTNPRHKKGLYDFSHGVEALKTLFPSPADLRRLDMAVFLAAKDIDLDEVNRIHLRPERQVVSASALKMSILWAWSRRADEVIIDLATTEAILQESSRLSRVYGAAEDIPLVSPADMRNKLVRLCVALAALLHSTDEAHEKVIVRPEHVQFVGLYLDSIYQAKNCRYHIYAGYATQRSKLDDVEIQAINKELADLDSMLGDTVSKVSTEILTLYHQHDVLTSTEISDLLDIDRRTVAKRLKLLQRHALIAKTRNGYHKTPKFIEYLSQL